MDYDALSAGVMLGGLTNRTEIRILICYILKTIDKPIPGTVLKEVLHYEGIANYFEVSYAISELETNNHIQVVAEDGDKQFMASQSGIDIAKTLEKNIPITIRELSCNAINKRLSRIRYEKENRVTIKNLEKGCIVSCSVLEGTNEVLTISLFVPDEGCAKIIKESFLDDPTSVFTGVTDLLFRGPNKKSK